MKVIALRTTFLALVAYSPLLCFPGRAAAHSTRGTLALRGGRAVDRARGAGSVVSRDPAGDAALLTQALNVEIHANITAAATQLETRLRAELASGLSAELAAFRQASDQQRSAMLSTGRAQFQGLQHHRQIISDAMQYAAVQYGITAAINATAWDTTRYILQDPALIASANTVLNAVRSTAGLWQVASNQSSAAAAAAVAAWSYPSAELNKTYTDIVGGLGHLNDASDGVTRAGRAVRWDEQESRLASDLSESTRLREKDSNAKVLQAEEQVTQVTRVVSTNRGALEALDGVVRHAEQEGHDAKAAVDAAHRRR